MEINRTLIEYINVNIIPLYATLDAAHQENHVKRVIKQSLTIGKEYNLNLNMMYTIAAFHDIGLIKERATHHLIGAKILKEDPFINSFFNAEEIKVMAEAIEDHRASNTIKPRSIYGMIISEADFIEPVDSVIARAILYRLKEKESFDAIYRDVRNHLIAKYGEDGYFKGWLNSKALTNMQNELWPLLKDDIKFKDYAYQIYLKRDSYK